MDLITSTVHEAGVNEDHTLGDSLDGGIQVDGGTTLLIHQADLQGVVRQTQQLLHISEQLISESSLIRAVLLRLQRFQLSSGILSNAARIFLSGEKRTN